MYYRYASSANKFPLKGEMSAKLTKGYLYLKYEVINMNVYDNANELAKAMRESHEFKKLKEAAAVLAKDADAKKMVNDYLQTAQEVEFAKHQGKEPDKVAVEKFEQLQKLLSLNADAMQYLNAFMRFQMMLMDVTNSIQDVVKEAMGDK